jgi:hypothetical protein
VDFHSKQFISWNTLRVADGIALALSVAQGLPLLVHCLQLWKAVHLLVVVASLLPSERQMPSLQHCDSQSIVA